MKPLALLSLLPFAAAANVLQGAFGGAGAARPKYTAPLDALPAILAGSRMLKRAPGKANETTGAQDASAACSDYCPNIPDGCYVSSGCNSGSDSCSWTYTVSGGGADLKVTLDTTTSYGSCSHTWHDTLSYSKDGYVDNMPSSWGITTYSDGSCEADEGYTDSFPFEVYSSNIDVGGNIWNKASSDSCGGSGGSSSPPPPPLPSPGGALPDGCYNTGDAVSCQDSFGNDAMCTTDLTISDSGTEMKASLTFKYDNGEFNGDHCTFILQSSLTYTDGSPTKMTETPDGDPTIQSGSSNCQVYSARTSTFDISVDDDSGDITLTAAGVSTTFYSTSCTNWVLILEIGGGAVGAIALLVFVICICYCQTVGEQTQSQRQHTSPLMNGSNSSCAQSSRPQATPPIVSAVHVPVAQPRNALPIAQAAPLPAPTPQPAAAQSPVTTQLQRLQAAEAKAVVARDYVVAGKAAVHCQALEQLQKRLNDLVAARNYSAASKADDELKTVLAEAEAFLRDLASDV